MNSGKLILPMDKDEPYLDVDEEAMLPPGQIIRVGDEHMEVIVSGGGTAVVIRGVNGTTATYHEAETEWESVAQ